MRARSGLVRGREGDLHRVLAFLQPIRLDADVLILERIRDGDAIQVDDPHLPLLGPEIEDDRLFPLHAERYFHASIKRFLARFRYHEI